MQTEYSCREVNRAIEVLKQYEGSYAGPSGHRMFHVINGHALDERPLIQEAWALDPNFLNAPPSGL
jgi:hypothetical protein